MSILLALRRPGGPTLRRLAALRRVICTGTPAIPVWTANNALVHLCAVVHNAQETHCNKKIILVWRET